jgi:hypothetical protein
MGSEVPKEFLEPRLSFMDGDRERLCMYGDTSDTAERVAGISTELTVPSWCFSSPGIARAGALLEGALLISRVAVGESGAPATAAISESLIAGMVKVLKMGCIGISKRDRSMR